MTHPLTFVQYDALIARLRELRDAKNHERWGLYEEGERDGQAAIAIELLTMLGEE